MLIAMAIQSKYLGGAAYAWHNTRLYLRPASQLNILFMLEFAPTSYA